MDTKQKGEKTDSTPVRLGCDIFPCLNLVRC